MKKGYVYDTLKLQGSPFYPEASTRRVIDFREIQIQNATGISLGVSILPSDVHIPGDFPQIRLNPGQTRFISVNPSDINEPPTQFLHIFNAELKPVSEPKILRNDANVYVAREFGLDGNNVIVHRYYIPTLRAS